MSSSSSSHPITLTPALTLARTLELSARRRSVSLRYSALWFGSRRLRRRVGSGLGLGLWLGLGLGFVSCAGACSGLLGMPRRRSMLLEPSPVAVWQRQCHWRSVTDLQACYGRPLPGHATSVPACGRVGNGLPCDRVRVRRRRGYYASALACAGSPAGSGSPPPSGAPPPPSAPAFA